MFPCLLPNSDFCWKQVHVHLSRTESPNNPKWKLILGKLLLQMYQRGQVSRLVILFFKEQKFKTHVSLIKEENILTNKSFLSSQIKLFFRKGTNGAFWWENHGHGSGGEGLDGGRLP